MTVSLLLAVTWAMTLPAFQAPDEQSHFNYVQTLAERFALPGEEGRPFFSAQVSEGIAAVNSDQVAAQVEVRPEWSDRLEDDWSATQADAPRDDAGGPGPAANYPPTGYAWQALGYLARRWHRLRRAAGRAADVGAVGPDHGARDLAARRRDLRPAARAAGRGRRGPGAGADVLVRVRVREPGRDDVRDLDARAVDGRPLRAPRRPRARGGGVPRARRPRVHGQGDQLCPARAGCGARRARDRGPPAVPGCGRCCG